MSQNEVHPLVDLAIQQLVSNGQTYKLGPKAGAVLPPAIVSLADHEFARAIRDLFAYAKYVEKDLRSPEPAKFFYSCAFAAAPRLKAIVEDKKASKRDDLQRSAKRFDQFLGGRRR